MIDPPGRIISLLKKIVTASTRYHGVSVRLVRLGKRQIECASTNAAPGLNAHGETSHPLHRCIRQFLK